MAATTALSIEPVRNRRQRDEYINLPFELYADNPAWVPPLRVMTRDMMLPEKNPLHRHAKIEHFIARNAAGKATGRIAVCDYPPYRHLKPPAAATFGFLDCQDDASTAKALLHQAEQWASARGLHQLRGPFNYTVHEECGLLLDGGDQPPAIFQPYNPPYYHELLRTAGYETDFLTGTYGAALKLDELHAHAPLHVLKASVNRITERHQLKIRQLDVNRLDREIVLMREVLNEAFSDNPDVVHVPEDFFYWQVKSMRPFLDPRLIFWVEKDGRPEGFAIAVPDINELLLRWQGRMRLWDLLRWKSCLRRIRTAVVLLIGARPSAAGLGVGRVIAWHLLNAMATAGYAGFHTTWIDDRNQLMLSTMTRLGIPQTRKYAIYRRVWSSDNTPSFPPPEPSAALNHPALVHS